MEEMHRESSVRSFDWFLRRSCRLLPALTSPMNINASVIIRLKQNGFASIVTARCEVIAGLFLLGVGMATASAREVLSINENRRFAKGDATSLQPFQSHDRKAFNGQCLVIVRGKPGRSGEIVLTSSADDLKSATIRIRSRVAK